jgi:hypothetical protein
MLSNKFLRDFRAFMSQHPAPNRYSKNQEGARDSGHYNSRFRKQAKDGCMTGFTKPKSNMVRDGVAGYPDEQNGAPLDPGTVDAIIRMLFEESGLDNDTAAAIAERLRQACPDAGAQDTADMDNPPANPMVPGRHGTAPKPGTTTATAVGTEAWKHPGPAEDEEYPGGPVPFPGMPKRGGGGQVPVRPQRSGIGMVTSDSSDYLRMFPQAANLAHDANALGPYRDGMPVRSTASRSARQTMAMDARSDDSYDRMFPHVRRIGLL